MHPGKTDSAAREVRSYLRARHHGMLATISRRLDGYPYGSVVPFVLDHAGNPVILISRLAEHTRNLQADRRTSLLVHEPSDEVQSGARLTLVGDADLLDEDTRLRQRFLRYLPHAEQLLALGDFDFWRIKPVTLRFIAGFGDIRWIPAADYAPPENTLSTEEDEILAHMNRNESDALRDCCLHYHKHSATDVTMIGVDCDGFDVRVPDRRLRFEFSAPAGSAAQVRELVAAMAREARRE
ncbi:MAG: pyridoxamine 5'-phosphate oxidase family protein [Betaproteobacteria bacterium]|nr:pyridoxamine 5'-phosphate oxidase family protein [Betaproteobacteria bacterium]